MSIPGGSPFFKSGGGSSSSSATGGAGAKNYLSTYLNNAGNGDFELNLTTGWGLGTVTLTNGFPSGVPTFGSGASGNLSFTTTGTGKLAGSYSGQYASSAATTSGNFLASNAFTIDLEDQAKVLSFKLYYSPTVGTTTANWSGTTSNSFGVAIYDVTNAVWIQPAGCFSMIQSSGVGLATGTFQTSSNSTSYRFVMYNANATSGAITLLVDDISVSPQITTIGSVDTDWVAYTPVFVGAGTVTNISARSRRRGPDLLVEGSVQLGTTTAVPLTMTVGFNGVSGNVQVDIGTRLSSNSVIGEASAGQSSTTYFAIYPVSPAATGTTINFGVQSSTTNAQSFINGTAISASAFLTFEFSVPIVGWGGSVPISSDSDTRVIAACGTSQTPSGTITTTPSVVKFLTIARDETSSYNTTTGLYTCPVTGWYAASAATEVSGGQGAIDSYVDLSLRKNGTDVAHGALVTGGATGSVNFTPTLSVAAIYCVAGDTLGFYIRSSLTTPAYAAALTASNFSISRLSGPAVIARSEDINCRYTSTAGTSVPGAAVTKIPFATIDYDSHGSWVTDTFTAKTSGKFRISGTVQIVNGSYAIGAQATAIIYKNGSAIAYGPVFIASNTFGASTVGMFAATTVSCLAGDTLDFRVSHISGVTGSPVVGSTAGYNHIEIERVAN